MPRLRFPHPLVLLVACIAIAAVLTYVLPPGEYSRRQDAATGREVVVPNTYHAVDASPVSPFQAVVSIPLGMERAGAVIFFVFIVGGAFAVVDRTGALRLGVDRLAEALGTREAAVIPICCVLFATAGALENMQEELLALIPALLLLTRRTGFDSLTAVAMSLGAAMVGSAFSPANPFQVLIAQKLAGLPQGSGGTLRTTFLIIALLLWTWGTLRHARRSRVPREAAKARREEEGAIFGPREAIVLALVLLTFAVFVYGVSKLGWDFEQESAVFFVMAVLAGLIGRLGLEGTAEAFVQGLREMAFAALLIGIARAISVVLEEGKVIDTIVAGLFTPIAGLPLLLSAAMMVVVQALIHIPVPSVSGQAALTMPILVPLSDLLGLSRQVTVLAYQMGAGLCEMITPTNGALMAILAAAGVGYGRWMRFAAPLYVALVVLGLISIGVGIAVGF